MKSSTEMCKYLRFFYDFEGETQGGFHFSILRNNLGRQLYHRSQDSSWSSIGYFVTHSPQESLMWQLCTAGLVGNHQAGNTQLHPPTPAADIPYSAQRGSPHMYVHTKTSEIFHTKLYSTQSRTLQSTPEYTQRKCMQRTGEAQSQERDLSFIQAQHTLPGETYSLTLDTALALCLD